MTVEQLETPDGTVVRSRPSPEEWRRSRRRIWLVAGLCLAVGGGLSALEMHLRPQLVLFGLLPAVLGLVWAARLVRSLVQAHPTAVVLTDHSLRLERLDGSHNEELDLAGVSSIRIGPDGFARPWRWLKGPREGLVVLRLRSTGQGIAIPPQLARHPVAVQLLARMLAASRSSGPVNLAGPASVLGELERRAAVLPQWAVATEIPPITIPAGWYPDPAGSGAQRWWDGRAWTDAVRKVSG